LGLPAEAGVFPAQAGISDPPRDETLPRKHGQSPAQLLSFDSMTPLWERKVFDDPAVELKDPVYRIALWRGKLLDVRCFSIQHIQTVRMRPTKKHDWNRNKRGALRHIASRL